MAISDTQKVDLLYKKIAWSVAKTDTNPPKEAYNESNPSPLLIRGDTLWQLSGSIPASIPTTTSSIVQVYKDGSGAWSSTIECTELAVTDNRTWSTGLTNWIDTQFGATYFVKVYVDTTGSTTPQTTGTALQAAGVNDDQWYFDYQAGILNFIGTNLPASIATGVTGKSVFISGARYIGPIGATNFVNGLTIGNITINGNTITGNTGVTFGGNVTTSSYFIGNGQFLTNIAAGNIVGAYGNADVSAYLNSNTITGNITTQGNISTIANVSANYFFGSGAYLTGLPAQYGNANVAVYLSSNTITGAITTQGSISTIANITAGNVTASAFYGNTFGTIATYSGNVSAGYFVGNAAYLTGLPATYGNANVATFLSAFGSNIINTTANITTTANVSASYLLGNVVGTVGTFSTLNAENINANVVSNNISANVFYGNMYYGNISVDTISPYQTSVTAFTSSTAIKLPSGITSQRPAGVAGYIRYNSQLNAVEFYDGTQWVSTTNTVASQTITGDGINNTFTLDQPSNDSAGILVSINGTVQQPGVAYTCSNTQITFAEIPQTTDVIDVRFLAASLIYEFDSVTPSVYLGHVVATTAPTLVDTFPVTGNTTINWVTSSNDAVNAQYKSSTVSSLNDGTNVYYTESAILKTTTSNVATFTSNITAGNINLWAVGDSASVTVTFERTVLGASTPTGYLTAGPAADSVYGNTQVAEYLLGSITTGNIIPSANVTYSLGTSTQQWKDLWVSNNTIYIGNTPITVSNGTLLVNNSPVTGGTTYSNANVVANLQNYVTNISTTANITTTANVISPNYLFANGVNILSTVTGGTTYSNANVVANLANYVTNIVSTANITAGNLLGTHYGNTNGTTATYSGNVAANYFVGNGAALTNVTVSVAGNVIGTQSNVTLVAGNYSSVFDNIGNVTLPATGNLIAGNATVNANTGNITARYFIGNVVSSGATNLVGNVSTGNLTVSGNLISTGYGFFPGAYSESSTSSGVFVGNTGTGTPSPRIGFFNGNTQQNWQIDNYGGQFRWFTPGVTQMTLDPTGSLAVTNATVTTLSVTGSATVTGNVNASGIGAFYAANRPAFRISGNGGSISSTTTVSGGYMVVDYNQGSYLNTSTGIFTAPVAGLYQVNAVVRAASNSGPSAQVIVRKTTAIGGVVTAQIMIEWAASTTMNHAGGSTIVKMAVGDTLKLDVTVGTVSFDGNDNWSVAYIG